MSTTTTVNASNEPSPTSTGAAISEPTHGDAAPAGFDGFHLARSLPGIEAEARAWYYKGTAPVQPSGPPQPDNHATTGEQLPVAASGAVVNVAEIKKQYPELDALDDNQVVDALHQAFYADLPREQVAEALGVKSDAALTQPSGLFRTDEDQGDDYDPAAFGEAGLQHALAIVASADINTEFGIAS